MTGFDSLIHAVMSGEALLIEDRLVAYDQHRLIICQRSDGGIYQAEQVGDEAEVAWTVDALERVYLSWSRYSFTGEIDGERLFRHIKYLHAMDETAAVLEAAEYLVSGGKR